MFPRRPEARAEIEPPVGLKAKRASGVCGRRSVFPTRNRVPHILEDDTSCVSKAVPLEGAPTGQGHQARVRSCERLHRNVVSFQGTHDLRYDVYRRTEMRAWDHVEDVGGDVENVTVLWYDDRWLRATLWSRRHWASCN